MIERTADIIYGLTGQSVETYSPEWSEGAPSSATAVVWAGTASQDGTSEFTPTVTADATSLTVDTASGYSQANRRRLNVGSTSGASVGRLYLLDNGNGQRELVKPMSVVTNDFLDLEDDLAYDYASGVSTVTGLRLSFTIDPTWVVTESKLSGTSVIGTVRNVTTLLTGQRRPSYKVIWAYSVNAIARRHYTYLRLVRQKAQHGVTVHDLKRYVPEIMLGDYKDARGNQARDLIDAAWDAVRGDILTEGHRPEQLRDTELLDQLVLRKAVYFAAWRGQVPAGWDAVAYAEQRRLDYEKFFARVFGGMRIDVDQGKEGGATVEPFRPFFFKR